MPSSCQLPQLPNCNKEARIQIPISFHLWREIRLLYSMPAMHVKAKESGRLAIESSDLLFTSNNSSLDSKEVTLYLHSLGGLGNNWPGIESPRILSSSSGRHHNRQPIVNSVHLGLITRWSSSFFIYNHAC